MRKTVAVITDSSACLSEAMMKEHDIYVSYLNVVFGETAYQEFKEISPEKFLQLCEAQDQLPSTSQAPIGMTIELYERIFASGYKEIIHLTISSGLSGSYLTALSAANMVESGIVHVIDSKTVSFAQAALAIEASKLAADGFQAVDIIPVLEELQLESHSIATVKTLENLQKGGRLSNASAFIGGMLQIKPIIEMTPEGKLEAVGKVRTFKKALDALITRVADEKLSDDYEIAIMHMDNEEEALELKERVEELYPQLTVHIVPFPLVVAVHIGQGAVGISWAKIMS